ncbi:MAG: hypothetical protein KAS69_02420 [Planctomycetes bacterium]|nr:hypothetical protein [Planctomycetota bacterium]
MIYNIDIKARVESNLDQGVLEEQLVIALHNTENQYSKFDGVDNNLEVIEYELTEAKEICPHCEVELISKMFDTDGANLVECNVCEKCGYGSK